MDSAWQGHIFVVARSDTDVQIVRYIPLSLFPSGQLNFDNFHQVQRMIRGIGIQRVVLDLFSNFKLARSSGYFLCK